MPNKFCPVLKAAQIIAHKSYPTAEQNFECDGTECAWANDEGFCAFRSLAESSETILEAGQTIAPAIIQSIVNKDENKDVE